MNCTARRPDLELEDTKKKAILLIYMESPNNKNKEEKREEKIPKAQQLCLKLREHQEGYIVKVVPVVI